MLFPAGTAVPEGFECVDLPPVGYAVCFIRDAEGSDGFYSRQTRDACLERIAALGCASGTAGGSSAITARALPRRTSRDASCWIGRSRWKCRQENEGDASERQTAD